MRELKKYKLRSAKTPQIHPLLSGIVQVNTPDGVGYSYIRFSEDFVDAIGKVLPCGLSPSSPGFLKVLFMPSRNVWRIFAMYVTEERGVMLWESEMQPNWLTRIRKN